MKIHKIPYRVRSLRNLREWSASFSGNFPSRKELAENPRYWNWKIPVYSGLVEGDGVSLATRRECAQLLIDACGRLIRAKPPAQHGLRVTCCIGVPDMFSSELCIYLQESYFLGHTASSKDDSGEVVVLSDRSLASEWGLSLPKRVEEHGVYVNYRETDTHEGFSFERWFFGEVAV